MNLQKEFKVTSIEPYDRHNYKLVYINNDSVIFDNYADLEKTWWESPKEFLSHVEILDKKKQKSKGKGFL